MQKPSRPAPAPPPVASQHRYTPTTNWDDSPFDAPPSTATTAGRKMPPPRPPPPRVQPSPVGTEKSKGGFALPFKKATPQSVNILSNLFGSRNKGTTSTGGAAVKLPPPPPALKKHHQMGFQPSTGSVSANNTPTAELIDWSSPPSSPTLTHKTFNSDCISVDSFSSETHSNTSPQNGSYYSQAESGFEDDFGGQSAPHFDLRRNVSNQFALIDPFAAPPVSGSAAGGAKIRHVPTLPPPVIAQKPKIVDQSAFYTQNVSTVAFQASSSSAVALDDPLSNGKSLIAPPVAPTMPTIIKPVILAKPTGLSTKPKLKPLAPVAPLLKRDSSTDSDKTPSPPMPIYAPPPPPPEYFQLAEEDQESYGIALYDYESEVEGDLNFRANDKIYLVRQENADWMFGRSKRGCEGLFPANYIEIKVPLRDTHQQHQPLQQQGPSNTHQVPKAAASPLPVVEETRRCRALYDFSAEADEDLEIREGDIITVIREINAEWLLGRKKNGTEGQFPAAFVEYL